MCTFSVVKLEEINEQLDLKNMILVYCFFLVPISIIAFLHFNGQRKRERKGNHRWEATVQSHR